MADGYLLGEDEVRRTAAAVRADEARRPGESQPTDDPHNNRQLRPFHKLPATTGNTADIHVVLGLDGFDFEDLNNVCSNEDRVEVRTTDQKTFTANETAFFEGTMFEQEIDIGLSLQGKVYLLGGAHTTVTGTKVTVDGSLFIELDDCPAKQVPFEWLTAPTDDVADGTHLIGCWVKSKSKYVAVLIDCEEA